jgi:copper resistance protein B
MGHCTLATPGAQAGPAANSPATPAAPACPPEHAAMGHCTPTAPQSADPHAGHAMGTSAPLPPLTPPPPEALSGPAHAQDLFFNPTEAAQSRRELAREHGGLTATRVLIDQLEVGIGKGRETYAWDGQTWYGGNINKVWLKTEGEGEFGGALEAAEVQALWSRAINPWFDFQAGVRQDFSSGPDRTHFVVGIQGLARYWFEVDAALFLSNKGDLTGRIEAEYDLRLTQYLILQPRLETDFSLQDIPALRIGAGLSTAEIGARLRYEFYPGSGAAVIAPYIGVEYERAFGDTADFRRADGEDRGDLRLLLGVRTWF